MSERFVRTLTGGTAPEARAVIQTAPGEEAQVDYGDGPMVRHPQTGKYRRVRLFVLTLGYSRKSVRLLTFQSSTRTWAELHQESFRRLGGSVRVMVLDNLREGVLKPDIYDPTLNPLYHDLLQHYGVTALPCRVRDPDRKGKVEAGVGHAKRTPLKGMRFESIDEAQRYLDHWEERWADTRIHGTTKRQVAAMFAEETPALQSLPDRHTGALLREHRRHGSGRYHTQREDRPRRTPVSTEDLLRRADRIGAAVGVLCRQLHAQDGETAVRRILGVLALARKYGADAITDACAAACELGLPTYRFVRRYLERRPPAHLALTQIDPLIRELTQYRDLITARTKEEDTR